MIHFISFGQSGYYYGIALDLLNRLKKAYPNSRTRIYSEKDLPKDYIEFAKRHPRGYGYWRWKPYIISDYLKSAEVDDIVVYIDGRCHFKSRKVEWLDSFVMSKADLCVWQLPLRENIWSTSQVFDFFRIDVNSYFANSGQIAALFLTLRKNNKTLMFINKWRSLLIDEPKLFSDYYESFSQMEDFIENRYDQSALSILVKLFIGNVTFIYCNRINRKNSIYIQLKSHDISLAKLKNTLKFILVCFLGYRITTKILRFLSDIKLSLKNYRSNK